MSDTVVQHDLAPGALAAWLRRQPDTWWSVDGDPSLMERINFPCSAEDLAAALEASKRDLVLHAFHAREVAESDEETLNRVADAGMSSSGNRSMTLTWSGSSDTWELVEDQDAAELARQTD